MRKYLLGGFSVIVLLIVGLFFTERGRGLLFLGIVNFFKPTEPFDPSQTAPALDYSDRSNWAALPDMNDLSDMIPADISDKNIQGSAPADVFFIHPTGYWSGANWISPMNPDSAAEENRSWMMANQASAYNGCCNVYAPRYREASAFVYIAAPPEKEEILGFAYQDVLAAFEYFLTHFNQGRPFIIASHSQGSHHAKRLLTKRIDGHSDVNRMVAAYVIGAVDVAYSKDWFSGLLDIKACESPTETQCVIHWDTYGEGGPGVSRDEDSLCTNPLTWRVDEQMAAADQHLGAVPPSGKFNLRLDRENAATNVQFAPLAAPLIRHTWAQCRNGTLFVADQEDTPFSNLILPERNYHGLDYSLFHINIRENAKERVAAFLNLAHLR